jgi:hypothetical protein
MKFREKLTIKVSRVPTVSDGTSNLNISIQTKHHVRVIVMGGELRILVCSFLVFPRQHKICSTTNDCPRLSHSRLNENKLTSKGLFWASTRRLHLAVRLLWSTSPIGNGCDKVAHGRLFIKVDCNWGFRCIPLTVNAGKMAKTLNYTRACHR